MVMKMCRYTNIDELLKRLNACKYSVEKITKRQATYNAAISDVCRSIDTMPAADVAEVRHGRWVDVEPALHNLFYATCSVCGKRQTIEVANYCPMCGASMGRRGKCVECRGGYCEEECGIKMDEGEDIPMEYFENGGT